MNSAEAYPRRKICKLPGDFFWALGGKAARLTALGWDRQVIFKRCCVGGVNPNGFWLSGLLAVCLWSCAAFAETRALLVGVSDYDADDLAFADLKGPANDVRLMRDVLIERGANDIRILADGVDGGARPTRAAIMAAFDSLAADAAEGDFVYIHLSGHGSRQGDPEGDETDGRDEIFLPIDVTRAERGALVVPNAITDDEIGRAVAAIRAKGADVWLVMDSCHSGSGLRAAAPGTATRQVTPEALGLDLDRTAIAEGSIVDTSQPDLPGGYLAFYSARSNELAREVDLGQGDQEDWYGLFSAKLAARLQGGGAISYRQLFQGILSDLADDPTLGGTALQTPSWEGDLIDAAVLGGKGTVGVQRFPVRADVVAAGLVHGLAEGTLLGLLKDAADPKDAVIAYAQVEIAEATRSFLVPVDATCQPQSDALCERSGSIPDGARFAQIEGRPITLSTVIAPPVDVTGTPIDPASAPALALVEAAKANPMVVIGGEGADIESLWADGQLWFAREVLLGESPVGLSWNPDDGTPLAPLLRRIGDAESLAKMLSAAGGYAPFLEDNPVRVTAQRVPSNAERLSPPNQGVSFDRECAAARPRGTGSEPIGPAHEIQQCDLLGFQAQAEIGGAFDVNRIYIDATFCVHTHHELIEDNRRPRRLGRAFEMCSDCPGGSYSAGDERAFVIVTEVRPNTENLNLQNQLETCGPLASGTRGPAAQAALDFLQARAERPGTRGSSSGFGATEIWVDSFTWRVLPKQEAFRRIGREIE